MSKMRFFALQELANRRPVKVDYPSEKLSDYYGDHVFDRKKMQVADIKNFGEYEAEIKLHIGVVAKIKQIINKF